MEGYWSLPKVRVLHELSANEHLGLTDREAAARLSRYGPNELDITDQDTALLPLWEGLRSPFVLLLVAASLLTALSGYYSESVVILATAGLNLLIGYYQQRHANRIVSKLRTLFSPTAVVLRQGRLKRIPARQLVPGDIIKLEAGNRVPADVRILSARYLSVNQAVITGESYPIHKHESTVSKQTVLANRTNCLYTASIVTAGQAYAVVATTGMATELGQMAKLALGRRRPQSKTEQEIGKISRLLVVSAVFTCFLALLFGLSRSQELPGLLTLIISIFVAIIPEGLPIAMTVALSLAASRMYGHGAAVRQLSAVEAAGTTTLICLDKTGTLTEGVLTIEKCYVGSKEFQVTGDQSFSGHFLSEGEKIDPHRQKSLKLLLELAAMASTSTVSKRDLKADRIINVSEPVEAAVATVACKAGYYPDQLERQTPEVELLPFSEQTGYSIALCKLARGYRAVIKGSPEKILEAAGYIVTATGETKRLLLADRHELDAQILSYAAQGYRVIALAYRDQANREQALDKLTSQLVFVGLLLLSDPIRPQAVEFVEAAKQLGLGLMIVTGDHLLTAEHTARELGIYEKGHCLHAQEALHRGITTTAVIARSTPVDKLRIIEKLQKEGQIVMMVGDGVNDAPALKAADIGVAVGWRGNDVAIEAADVVLTKNNLLAITEVVTQGRLFRANLRKVIAYLLTSALSAALLIITSFALAIPFPLTALQILWLNFVTDCINSFSLLSEKPAELPTSRNQALKPIFSFPILARVVGMSAVSATIALYAYLRILPDSPAIAQTAALTLLVFCQLFNLLNYRSNQSIFERGQKFNRTLLATTSLSILLQLSLIYERWGQHLFGTVALDWPTVVGLALLASILLVVSEIVKLLRYLLVLWQAYEIAWK